jgi:hypothetical protein
MRIVAIHERTIPLSSASRNASISFDAMMRRSKEQSTAVSRIVKRQSTPRLIYIVSHI